MERHDFYLLVTQATCTALAIATFLIMPYPSPRFPFSENLFLVVTMSIFCQLILCFITMSIHVCVICQWMPPEELFEDGPIHVILHWAFTFDSLVFASVGLGMVYGEQFRHNCGGSSQAVCRIRCELAAWLALVTAANGIVDALLVHWQWRRRAYRAAQTG
ncbi:unnamed protein product [Alopecurus aequalis]